MVVDVAGSDQHAVETSAFQRFERAPDERLIRRPRRRFLPRYRSSPVLGSTQKNAGTVPGLTISPQAWRSIAQRRRFRKSLFGLAPAAPRIGAGSRPKAWSGRPSCPSDIGDRQSRPRPQADRVDADANSSG
jgi:hypothetical protein